MSECKKSNVLEAETAHKASEAKCLDCGFEWVAIAPIGAKDLECPNCTRISGEFKDDQGLYNQIIKD